VRDARPGGGSPNRTVARTGKQTSMAFRSSWYGWLILAVVVAAIIFVANNSGGPTSRPALPPSTTTLANVGDEVMVHGGPWICGSTKEAFSEVTGEAVNGKGQMLNAIRRTHSFMLLDGTQVKAQDIGIVASKVRVLGQFDPDDGRVHAWPEDARVGRECWVASEALRR
jgi:hypothetical protein